ncbi:hypothetical protein SmJEL517_g03623 [Synchytrium microbalum]|uniref:enoyl-[acyl-carrier-protein] reductase n=1 Tax=Synchytrium microbalum TaxID=1806994 RepID=A0A507C299_9FUNG|nr:uncharacterized protein SmJEL517_g03623 [Synchytrium microbalum]TPX33488.1 hypothetical protein SmJEL517_g03623 [Synchytrium microbalum]
MRRASFIITASSYKPLLCNRIFPRHSSTALAICHAKYGDPAKVLKIQKIPLGSVYDNNVKIKFLAAPINPADINQIQGVYPVKPIFHPEFGAIAGTEGVAEVVATGLKVKDLQVGDWVIPVEAGWGTWRDYAIAQPSDLLKLSIKAGDKVSALSAASITVNPSTAYRMLTDFVLLEPSDVVIQNGANSAVGQAVIQLAAAWGIKTVNIVRSRPDLPALVDKLKSLGATLVLTEEELATPAAKEQVKALKAPPIQLALNCVGGSNASNMARLLGDNAHLVTYGGMSRQPLSLPASAFIFKHLTTHGYWMTRWYRTHSKQERTAMIDELFKLIRAGKLREPDAQIHDVKDTSDASQEAFTSVVGNTLQGFSTGKTVLKF